MATVTTGTNPKLHYTGMFNPYGSILGACRDENFRYVESIGYGQSHACKLLILRRRLLLSDSLLGASLPFQR
jgi:hypothetical protein